MAQLINSPPILNYPRDPQVDRERQDHKDLPDLLVRLDLRDLLENQERRVHLYVPNVRTTSTYLKLY